MVKNKEKAMLQTTTNIFDGPYRLTIAGDLVDTEDYLDVLNPATGEVFARLRTH